ncbi:MAG: protein kinase, partial [Thermoanaerobaculia bacterium]
MSVEPGQSLSHFRITAKIGEGGMGEVYQAHDSKLGREVAIKVLPDAVAADPDRLSRFQREAKVLAALNHPSIAGIYQVEEVRTSTGSVHFLVMELAPGETLAERIERGAVPVKEAVAIALQIAEAMEAAHDRGIIHRDLKPANIKLSAAGQVKVLDFGLAKALADELETSMPATALTQSPTLTVQGTKAGVLLGTAAYMSPEQARGEAADRRADIWAFGVVLFEMLSGKMVYQGRTVSDILAGILAREPEWEQLEGNTPRPVMRLLQRCLHKEASERLQAIGEARIRLRRYLDDPSAGAEAETTATPATATGSQKLGLASLAVGLVAVTLALTWMGKPAPPAPEPLHVEATVHADGPLMTGIGSSVVLSRDGKLLVYNTGDGTNPVGGLYLRRTHQLEAEHLSGTDRGYNQFFSPDGRWIGFVTPTELKKVAISGGTPLTLCPVRRNRGSTWGPDGTIVFAPDPTSGLMQVSAAGGEPQEFTTLEEGEVSHRWPQFLPGGRQILYTAYTSTDRNQGRIKIADRETGQSRIVHEGGTDARYADSGHLLYWREGTVFAAPFDLEKLEMTTLPASVLHEVVGNLEGGAQFDVAGDGTLVYLHGEPEASAEIERRLMLMDRSGQVTPASELSASFDSVEISPDGKRLATVRYIDGNGDVWVVDRQRDTPTRLTFNEDLDIVPRWSADGKWIYFSSRLGVRFQIYRKPADGSREAEL